MFLVDSGSTQNADRVLAAIKALQARLQQALPAAPRSGAETTVATNLEPFYRTLTPPKPIRYIANTSALPDHTGGNEKLALAGKTFTGGNVDGRDRRRGRVGRDPRARKRAVAPGRREGARPRACRPTRTSAPT